MSWDRRFGEALAVWEAGDARAAEAAFAALLEAGDAPAESDVRHARALHAAGRAGAHFVEPHVAALRLERACELLERLGAPAGERADALFDLGNAYQYDAGRNAQARIVYERGRALAREAAVARAVVRGDYELGTMLEGDAPEEAAPLLEACARACEALHDEGDPLWVYGHGAAVALHRVRNERAAAVAAAERAVALRRRVAGDAHVELGEDYATLSAACVAAERPDDARRAYEQAKAIFDARLGVAHRRTMDLVAWLAGWEAAWGTLERGEAMLRAQLDAVVRAASEPHVAVFDAWNMLGDLYWGRDRRDEAWPLYLRAVRAGEAALGALHPRIVTYRSNIASSFDDDARRADVIAMLKTSLDASLATLSPDEAEGAYDLLRGLGMYLARAERMDERRAEIAHFREACDARLGPSHPIALAALHDELESLPFAEKGHEARLRRAIALFEPVADASPDYLESALTKLGFELQGDAHRDERRATWKRVLDLWEKHLSPERPSLTVALACYARELPQPERKAVYDRALVRAAEVLGARHAHIAYLLNEMSSAVPEVADEARRRALALVTETEGEESAATAAARDGVASLLEERAWNDPSPALLVEALSLRQRSWETYRARAADEPARCAWGAKALAAVLTRLDRGAEAARVLEEGAAALRASGGEQALGVFLGEVLSALGDVYAELGDLEGGARAYAEGAAAYARQGDEGANASAQCELQWGRALAAAQRFADAAAIFERLDARIEAGLKVDLARRTQTVLELGDAAFQAGQLERAMHAYERIIVGENDALPYQRACTTVRLAAIYGTGLGSFGTAKKLFETGIGMLTILLGEDGEEVLRAREGLAMLIAARGDERRAPPKKTTTKKAAPKKPAAKKTSGKREAAGAKKATAAKKAKVTPSSAKATTRGRRRTRAR